jgi:hypothetical protein
MADQPPRTERSLRERLADADRRMRRAERAAYVQAFLALLVYVILAARERDPIGPAFYALLAVAVAVLGWMVGHLRNALAAGLLLGLILGGALYQVVTEKRAPAMIVVVIFAWIYGQALSAAREHATLRVIPVAPDPPTT